MDVTKVKSQSRSEATDAYSRAVQVGDWVFVSITAGVNYADRALSTDPAEQANKAIDNVEASLKAVGCELADVVQARVFIPHQRDFEAVIKVFGERFRGIDPANTVLCAPLGSPDLRVEMEATAHRGVGAASQNRVSITL